MGKFNIKIGVVCLARQTFDYRAASTVYEHALKEMAKIENLTICAIEELVISKSDAQDAAQKLLQEDVDGVAIISGTFHLGHLALMIHRKINKPSLLWGFNELPYNGGKIRLNSVCGVNLNASNLYKAGYDDYSVHLGDEIDESWIDALRMKVILEKKNIGLAGFRADGFFNLAPDEMRNYNEAGVLVDHFELEEMFSFEPEKKEVDAALIEVKEIFDCSDVSEEQVFKVARLCATVNYFLTEKGIDALAIRCWPEYANNYGISPCAMMSILQAKGQILACEGDVEGSMTMLGVSALGVEAPFLADLSQVNIKQDFALMWHCGVAPASLWDKKSIRSLDTYFAGGKGVTADFVLKSGKINIIRFDSARGKTRVLIGRGEALPADKELKGTFAKVRYENHISEVLDVVTTTGVAHHVIMIYGEYLDTFRRFARLMNWEVIEV